MALLTTPVCDFGKKADNFNLNGVDSRKWSLEDCKGEKGLLVMFICNHCPYVQALIEKLAVETAVLAKKGIGCVAINPNDYISFPEDSFDNMIIESKKHGFSFPYLLDESQEVVKKYGAICTPDFYGYNSQLELQYRGRFDDRGAKNVMDANQSDLFKAMMLIARTGKGPEEQIPSIGCSIKWRNKN